MSTLAERIVTLLQHTPGLTDRDITDQLKGHSANQVPINTKCRDLKSKGILIRKTRADGLIGNYLASQAGSSVPIQITKPIQPGRYEYKPTSENKPSNDHLSEDDVKRFLEKWLVKEGWSVRVAWGQQPGIDMEARQGTKRWGIEVKGCGSRSAMRVNYFLNALGETLQRMVDPDATYSIAFPDMQQFRRLWDRLPDLAKQRLELSALFVDRFGNVVHV